MEKEQTETGSIVEESYPICRLQFSDKDKGFVNLLKQHSISDTDFVARFEDISSHGDDHIICVIKENHSKKIIAIGIFFIEKKFIRNCGKVGLIEDIVVDSSVRGKHLGQKIIRFLSEHANQLAVIKSFLIGMRRTGDFMRSVDSKRKVFKWNCILLDSQDLFIFIEDS